MWREKERKRERERERVEREGVEKAVVFFIQS